MNDALMNAILSMDSYNRGYDAGIDISETDIGEASIKTTIYNGQIVDFDSAVLGNVVVNGQTVRADSAIGFYALAYSYNGETIISYRGTDSFDADPDNPLNAPDDIYHGWSLGLGTSISEQGLMAIEFYKSLAGAGNYRTANISMTGHIK